jgi:carbonic anhydrase
MSATTRRHFVATAGVLPFITSGDARGEEQGEPFPKSGDEALERLKAGNQRFASGHVKHAHEAANWRKQLVASQHPFATVIGCSDSRVPTELVFDQGFGDIFVIRLAGNVIDADVVGSAQYAIRHLKTPLLVVMGHETCGAVTAAIEALEGKAQEPKYIDALLKRIEPGLKGLDPNLKGPSRISAAVELNVRWSLRQLLEIPDAKSAMAAKGISLVGAVYDLTTGQVRFLDKRGS